MTRYAFEAEPQDWAGGRCVAIDDKDMFYPVGAQGAAKLQIEEAKYFCLRCDIRTKCLEYALETGQDHGVWGGLSEDERRVTVRRGKRSQERAIAGARAGSMLTGDVR